MSDEAWLFEINWPLPHLAEEAVRIGALRAYFLSSTEEALSPKPKTLTLDCKVQLFMSARPTTLNPNP